MALTDEQVRELKKQLNEQIKNLPDEQRNQAQEQIDKMSAETLELMLKQQTARQSAGARGKKGLKGSDECVFCMIARKEIESSMIDENEEAIAVLEINPVSKGHAIVIPKKHVTKTAEIPEEALKLAKKTAKNISEKLEAKEVDIVTDAKLGHAIINVIPSYDKKVSLENDRKKAEKSELDEISRKLKEEKMEVIKMETEKKEKPLKLKRRIP